ncbi:MAG: molecular chaperone TorD family protein [Hyphomicrobiales bacterium]|nr:molecular chaperone TorD family protein [Hyphomicrobiales bacterium]
MQAFENTASPASENFAGEELVSEEDRLRAQIYRLIAVFLSCPPTQKNLKKVSGIKGDDGEFGRALNSFAKIAGNTNEKAVDTEFHDLFIGVTRGELLPFGSYYQTGFLHEKPLARLRTDMAEMGIERVEGLKEPEDHIASVLEIMAGLIEGTYDRRASLAEQKVFFDRHVNSWASQFFTDLENAGNSVLYSPLGSVGRLFMDIEREAFDMS